MSRLRLLVASGLFPEAGGADRAVSPFPVSHLEPVTGKFPGFDPLPCYDHKLDYKISINTTRELRIESPSKYTTNS